MGLLVGTPTSLCLNYQKFDGYIGVSVGNNRSVGNLFWRVLLTPMISPQNAPFFCLYFLEVLITALTDNYACS